MSAVPASGRIVCPRCGANNFNTQAACWKCGSPLLGAGPLPGGIASPQSSVSTPSPLDQAAAPRPPTYASSMDPSVAVWSGIALALFFPFLAVPVGLVFLMVDDRRRAEIGRLTLIWGLISSLAQVLLTFGMLKRPYDEFIRPFVSGGRLPAPAQPNANDIVPSEGLPPGFK